MNLVHRRFKVSRTQFRKLPFDTDYWLASNLATVMSEKLGRRTSIGGYTPSTGALTQTAVADTTVAVVKVPLFLSIQQ